MKIGLIKGRHSLPVEKYLLDSAEFGTAHSCAFEAMYELAKSYNGDIDLYLTGLTRAALGAIEGWRRAKSRTIECAYEDCTKITNELESNFSSLNIFEFNTLSGQYESKICYRMDYNDIPTYGGIDDVIKVFTWGEMME